MDCKKKNIAVPKQVNFIIDTLRKNGYEAYAVGGCVRDSILKKEPKDWDITTSAKPEVTKSFFNKTIDTGIKHGTVTIMIKGEGYEVTTYRVDGEYEDGRHPKEVTFTANLSEDLKRRDFTINAMAYNEENGIVDMFGGIDDIENKIIKCVGNPIERFTEDALRMLRAIRFSAVLDFKIEEATKEAIKELAPTIKKISRERIQVELDKLIMSDHPNRVTDLYETGLLENIFEMESDESLKEKVEKMAELLMESEKNHFVRWGIFVSCLEDKSILKSLKFDNNTVKISNKLAEEANRKIRDDEAGLRFDIVEIGKDIFKEYYIPYRKSMKNIEKDELENIEKMYEIIIERKDALSIKELAISGKDLNEIGVEQGKVMGEIIKELFEMVLLDHTKNKKEILIEQVKNRKE